MGLLSYTPLNNFSQNDVNQSKDQYGQAQNAYNQNQQQLKDYTNNMQSGTDMYAQQQGLGNQWAGYDPARLAQSLGTLQQTQNVVAGLPQAVQAQNANYGATASDLAGQYSGMMNNLNPALAAQTNAVAKNQATQQAALGYAQQGTSAGLQGQQQKLTGLQSVVQNSLQQMDQARQVMQNYQELFQNQGKINADQLANYNQAKAAYLGAQAAMSQASTAAKTLQFQMDAYNKTAAQTAAAQARPSAATSAAPSGGSNLLSTIGQWANPLTSPISAVNPNAPWMKGLSSAEQSFGKWMNGLF